jgi:threonylcarbamoyladenosine tRNA methylthiotransferase CDKAL1
MTSPQWVIPRLAEYLDLFDHPKLFVFFHVPLQSGSDRTLRLMRRDGTVADFERLARAFQSRFPEGTLLTDLIAGFPGETDEDFEATLALVDRLRLPGANVSRFSPRPGTAAARMPGLPAAVVAARTRALMRCVRDQAAAWHAARIGRRYPALIERVREDGRSLGRTDAYRSVLFDDPLVPGRRIVAEITGAADFSFRGMPVAESGACAAAE